MAETFKSNHVALTTSNADIVGAIAASTTAIVLSIRATTFEIEPLTNLPSNDEKLFA